MIADGKKAPDFKLPDETGNVVQLSKLKGRPVVVYFYPKDDTSGCTQEAKDFSCLAEEFAGAGAEIVGISPDGALSHQKFKSKYDLSAPAFGRREKRGRRSLRSVGREIDVRKKIHGGRALDLLGRQVRQARQELEKGEGARSRRGGSGRRPVAFRLMRT